MSNDNHQGQLKIWGRKNSVNVQKVLWCLSELDLAYERIDAGMAFGRNNEPDYLAMNPERARADAGGRRFRALGIQFDHALSRARLSPGLADLSRWRRNGAPPSTAGWTGRFRPCSRSIVRCSGRWCEPRSNSATWSRSRRMSTPRPRVWRIVDAQLATRRFIEGDDFTIADIALGAYARRWLGVEGVQQAAARASRPLVRAIRRRGRDLRNSWRRRCRERPP